MLSSIFKLEKQRFFLRASWRLGLSLALLPLSAMPILKYSIYVCLFFLLKSNVKKCETSFLQFNRLEQTLY